MVRCFVVSITVLAAACALTIPLVAGQSSSKHARVQCPTGPAKKPPHCVPPGQAKKFYRRGDHILSDYIWIGEPGHWAPDPYATYVQAGGFVYQVNRETHKVLRLIGAAEVLAD